MNIIKQLNTIIEFLVEERQQFETMGILTEIVKKITPKYDKGDIVRSRLLPNTTYEVDKIMFNFEDEQEYCHIKNDYEHFVVKSKDLERIE